MYRATMYAWRRGRTSGSTTCPCTQGQRGFALAASLAVALALGCGASQPRAPYVAPIDTAQLSAELRSDTPVDDDERAMCDAVRAAEAAMQSWYGAAPRTTVRVWMLTPDHHARYLHTVDGDANIGAITRVGRRTSDIYVSVPSEVETDEGRMLELRLCQFQLAHEVVHAWLGRSAASDSDEGLANFIAQRALESLDSAPGQSRGAGWATLTGPYDAMQGYCRFVERERKKPIPVEMMARARGEEAYILPWLLLEFAARDLSREQFQAFARWMVTSASPAEVERRLVHDLAATRKQGAAAMDVAAEISAFMSADRDRSGRWFAPPGFIGVGRRPDGTAVLLGEKSIVFAALTDEACLGEDADELDRALGGPALTRCSAFRARRVQGELQWSAHSDGGLVLGEPIPSELTHSSPGGDRLATAIAPAGEWITLSVEQPDLVLRCHKGNELARWKGGACSIVKVSYRQRGSDGILGVVEIEPTRITPAPDRAIAQSP